VEKYTDDIYEELSREYIKIREENKRKQEKIIARIYSDIPRIKAIDDEISKLGLSAASAVLKGEASPRLAVRQMQEQMELLVSEKNKLLAAANYPPDAMKEIYSCTKCRDKGYIDGKRCSCYIQKRSKLLQQRANICMCDKNTFENFNLNIFSDKIDTKYGVSPRENMKSIFQIALSFARCEKDTPKNLLFYGATGLGKTFVSDCIAKKYIESGKTVFYMSAPRLFSTFEDYKFGRDTSAISQRTISSVNNAELLIIDDLGTEFKTAYSDSILFDIINSRIITEKPMIISTNLSTKELKHTYSERICSRILGNFSIVLFFGEDLRMKNI
jgi:DNA replication protein DnaC